VGAVLVIGANSCILKYFLERSINFTVETMYIRQVFGLIHLVIQKTLKKICPSLGYFSHNRFVVHYLYLATPINLWYA